MTAWAVRLPMDEVAAAGRLRSAAGIEVCADGDAVWLRGDSDDKALHRRLRQLPGAERFTVLDGGRLRRCGRLLPKGRLPAGPWTPLAAWLVPAFPVAILPGRSEERIAFSLRPAGPSSAPEEPGMVLTDRGAWREYTSSAPQVRLDRWTFAASADGRVLVRGRPLPPIAGRRLVDRDGVAVPAGWTWSPPIEPAVVRRLLGLADGDVALLLPEDVWERIAAEEFVRASRSAARMLASGGKEA